MTGLELLKQDLNNIPIIVEKYTEEYQRFKDELKLKGRSLQKANTEQPGLLSFYDEKRIELRSIVTYLEIQRDREYGKLWAQYTENYSRDLSVKDKEHYIKYETSYVTLRKLILEVDEIYQLFESAVESFKARGYALNNLTRLVAAEAQDYLL